MFLFEILVKSWIEEYISLNISLPTILLKKKSPMQLFPVNLENSQNSCQIEHMCWNASELGWYETPLVIEAATRGVL